MNDAMFWLIVSQWPDPPSWPDDSTPPCPRCYGTGMVGGEWAVPCRRCTPQDVTSTGHDAAE